MEINDVLEQFIRICNTGDALLQLHLASNSVLEWFGRTIRGRANIYSYYRFDLCQQYEHCFEKAEQCLPIEYKPSHMQTKKVSTADVVNAITATVNKTLSSDDHSTPLQRIITPTLPKVGNKKDFINTSDVSSMVNKNPHDITPPSNTGNQSSETDGPPAKRLRFDGESSCAGNAADSSHEFIQNKYYHSQKCDTDVPKVEEIGQGDCILLSHDKIDSIEADTGYTDLMYLESIGTLRIRNKVKHRGIANGQYAGGVSGRNLSPTSSSNIDLTNSSYERKTKLKVSYRIRLHDNQLQIALIIYEHLSRYPATRRNLFHEFQVTSDTSDSVLDTKTIVTPKQKPKKSLKRALRLF